jgi:uncharacterized membrane protein YcaP (DUF421 family)
MLIFTRILGKREISQLTFFDYITGISMGSIAAKLSTDISTPAPQLWLALLVWVCLAILFEWIALKNRRLAKVLDGEPTILVHNGKILEKNMKATRFRLTDLMEQLRQKDVFEMSDVEFALLETDGKVSVLKKSQAQPITPASLNLPTSYRGVSTELIVDGEILYQNLEQLDLSVQWLDEELNKKGISDHREVVYASLDTQGNLYIDKFDDNLSSPTDIGDYPGPY